MFLDFRRAALEYPVHPTVPDCLVHPEVLDFLVGLELPAIRRELLADLELLEGLVLRYLEHLEIPDYLERPEGLVLQCLEHPEDLEVLEVLADQSLLEVPEVLGLLERRLLEHPEGLELLELLYLEHPEVLEDHFLQPVSIAVHSISITY